MQNRCLCVALLAAVSGCVAPERAVPPPTDPELAGTRTAAGLAFQQGQHDRAADLYRRALVRARAADRADEIGDAAYNLAVCMTCLGDYDRARRYLAEARYELRETRQGLADVRLLGAKIARAEGKRGEALQLAQEVKSDPQSQSSDSHVVMACLIQGAIAADQGDAVAAREGWEDAKRRGRNVSSPVVLAAVAELGGRVLSLEQEPAGGARLFDRQSSLLRESRDYRKMADALARAARAYREAGELGVAADRFFRAARSCYAQGRMDTARALLAEARASARAAGDSELVKRVQVLPGDEQEPTTER